MLDIGLGHYLTLGAIIFTIGIIGIFLNRKNISASASAAISGAVLKGVTQLGAIAYGGYRYSADAKLAQNAALNTGMGYSGSTFESLGGITPYMGSSVFGTSNTSFQPLGGA